MSSFADRLAAARLIALDRLVKIAEHSEDETEARLAAAAILKITAEPPPPARRAVTDQVHSSPAAAPPAADQARPRDQSPDLRQITNLINAMGRSIDVLDRSAHTPAASATPALAGTARAPRAP